MTDKDQKVVPQMTPEERDAYIRVRVENFAKLPRFGFGDKIVATGGFYNGHKGYVDGLALVLPEDQLSDGTVIEEVFISYKVVFKWPLGLTTREVQAEHMTSFEGELDFTQ